MNKEKHFLLNGKSINQLEGINKIILTNIIKNLSDISSMLTQEHYIDFIIIDNQSSKFDFNLPDLLIKRVIETCITSKNNQVL